MPKVILSYQPEVLHADMHKPQILSADNPADNAALAVQFASKCWKTDGELDFEELVRVTNELKAYMRFIKEGKA